MRYELQKTKFWEIEVAGRRIKTRFGKIGATGQTQLKVCATPKDTQREHDRMVAAKCKTGYVAVDLAERPAVVAHHGKTDPSLEKAIAADVEGSEAYLVYADWLQSQGDPRGELITLQHKRGPAPRPARYSNNKKPTAPLDKAEAKLLAAHGEALFGPLAPFTKVPKYGRAPFHVDWHLGFFRSARISSEIDHDVTAEWMLERLWDLPAAKFLRELSIGELTPGDMPYYPKFLPMLIAAAKRAPPTLRSLHLGDFTCEEWEVNWAHIGPIAKLVKAYPKLHRLGLHGTDIDLGTLAMPELRVLDLHSDSGTDKLGPQLARANLPALETLKIELGPNTGELPKLEAVFDGRFPKLRHLWLEWYDPTKAQLEALCTGKALAKLETLALHSCGLVDNKAALLVAHARRFSHLTWLELDNNLLAKSVPAVKKLCADVRLGKQQRYDDVYEW